MCEMCKDGELRFFKQERSEVEAKYEPISCPECYRLPEWYMYTKAEEEENRLVFEYVWRLVDHPDCLVDHRLSCQLFFESLLKAGFIRKDRILDEIKYNTPDEIKDKRVAKSVYHCHICKDGTGNRTKVCGVCGKTREYYEGYSSGFAASRLDREEKK